MAAGIKRAPDHVAADSFVHVFAGSQPIGAPQRGRHRRARLDAAANGGGMHPYGGEQGGGVDRHGRVTKP